MTELKATNSKYKLDTSKTHMLGSDKHYLIRSNIGVVAAVPLWPNNDEAYANAHLLRSARELYDALVDLTATASVRAGNVDPVFQEPIANAEAALRAARGEATE